MSTQNTNKKHKSFIIVTIPQGSSLQQNNTKIANISCHQEEIFININDIITRGNGGNTLVPSFELFCRIDSYLQSREGFMFITSIVYEKDTK